MESRMVKKAPRGLFCIAASQPLTSTLWERLWCWLEYSFVDEFYYIITDPTF